MTGGSELPFAEIAGVALVVDGEEMAGGILKIRSFFSAPPVARRSPEFGGNAIARTMWSC